MNPRLIRKVLTVTGVIILGISVFLVVFVGIPFEMTTPIYILSDYPRVDEYTIAVKFKAFEVFYVPVIKWNKEFIKGQLKAGTKYVVLEENLRTDIEAKFGNFHTHLPWQYTYGWLMGLGAIILLILGFIGIVKMGGTPDVDVS